jgi:hypothetical protein
LRRGQARSAVSDDQMAYILGEQRNVDCKGSFERYSEFLRINKEAFPAQAFALATSDWYYNPEDPRCPHDSWLEKISIAENAEGTRQEIRQTNIHIRLLGAYHNGYIELFYPEVFIYSLQMINCTRGHLDWLYDEFRLSSTGHLIHEIQWAGAYDSGTWVIEASDVEYKWFPL